VKLQECTVTQTQWKLERHASFTGRQGPMLMVIMDGVAVGRHDDGDAVYLANKPVLDHLWEKWPTTTLCAHGPAVGLPSDDDMGNSEVGHNALGAGQVYAQGAKLVNAAIETGALFQGAVWREIVARCTERRSKLHFIGLLSDGNVHSHIDQLFALLRSADAAGLRQVYVHPLTDGRDVPARSALQYVDALEALLVGISNKPDRRYRIASGGGRMLVTMDRYEADWEIVHCGWKAHVRGDARPFNSAREAIETFYAEDPNVNDQFLPPFVIHENGHPVARIEDGDAAVYFNFRGDRAIEISRAFEEDDFDKFDRGPRPDVLYAGMMQYDGDLLIPKRFLVSPPHISRTMGEFLARNGVTQLAIAETQKYGHVTYFWNGNRGGMFDEKLETYVEIPSDRVPFEQRPWMKAAEVTDRLIEELRSGRHRLLRVNYANGDMVGHTGSMPAARVAVEAVDLVLGRLLPVVKNLGGIAVVTADHGNADEMYQIDAKTGGFKMDRRTGRPQPKTAHTLNAVPFSIFDPRFNDEYALDPEGKTPGLSNVAATVLNLMGFNPPDGWDASLIRFK
jgi:2,3-bisphosphoglycerate-independent phosphoglycerate mutase